MQLPLKALHTHLNKALLPLYLISSDELYLVESVRTKIIDAAAKNGFVEREIIHMDIGFKPEHLLEKTQNKDLFSTKKLIDLRNFNAKFDDQLLNFFKNPVSDLIIIISTSKLSSAQQKSKWYQQLTKIGAHIPIWPISPAEYPSWIDNQAKTSKINIDREAVLLLANATEGNLFAAAQAIEKCALLYPNASINAEKMIRVITDNTQFSVFDLTNALLASKTKRAIDILTSLRKTGTDAILALWAITREIRELIQYLHQMQAGIPQSQILSRVFTSKKALVQKALATQSLKKLYQSLQLAATIDEIIKGAKPGDPWSYLEDLCILLS